LAWTPTLASSAVYVNSHSAMARAITKAVLLPGTGRRDET
jgi:hypothetical protein